MINNENENYNYNDPRHVSNDEIQQVIDVIKSNYNENIGEIKYYRNKCIITTEDLIEADIQKFFDDNISRYIGFNVENINVKNIGSYGNNGHKTKLLVILIFSYNKEVEKKWR